MLKVRRTRWLRKVKHKNLVAQSSIDSNYTKGRKARSVVDTMRITASNLTEKLITLKKIIFPKYSGIMNELLKYGA